MRRTPAPHSTVYHARPTSRPQRPGSRRPSRPEKPRGGGGKRAGLIVAVVLVFLLAAGGTAFVLLGGMDLLFAEPPVAYTAEGEVRALTLDPPPEGAEETAMRAHFADAVAFAKENGFNTLIFKGKAGLPVWWRDGIFPPVEPVAEKDGFLNKFDPLALLCEAVEGQEIQLWLAVEPYAAGGYYPNAKGKAVKLADENGAPTLLNFDPAGEDYQQLLVQSLAALPKKYPLAGLVLDLNSGEERPGAAQLEAAVPGLLEALTAALAEAELALPVSLAIDPGEGGFSAAAADAQVAAGTVARLLVAVQPGQGLNKTLAALTAAGRAESLLPVYVKGDSAGQVFFAARQNAAYGGALFGAWPAASEQTSLFAFLKSALTPAEGTLTAGFDIPAMLAVNYPEQNARITTEGLFIMGTSDPNLPLMMNGAELATRGANGAFGVGVELVSGENQFEFSQPGGTALTLKVEKPEPTGGGGGGTGTMPADGTLEAKKGQVVRVTGTNLSDIASALTDPDDDASMNETLPKGAVFIVEESVRTVRWSAANGRNERTWAYRMKSGDYVLGYNCTLVSDPGAFTFTGITVAADEYGEYLNFEGAGTPAAYVHYDEETGQLWLTFYDTTLTLPEGFSSATVRGATVEAAEDGATVLKLQTEGIWGYSLEYGENSTRLHLKKPPALGSDPQRPLAGVRILLDPGHGGDDVGAPGLMGSTGPNEKDVNFALANAIAYRLRQLGAEVLMTREADTTVSLKERLQAQTDLKPDFFLSVHHNSANLTQDLNNAKGTHSFYYHPYNTPPGKRYAQNLLDCIDAATGRTSRADGAAEWGYYYVTRTTVCPSVLFEYGFIVNPAEFEDITSADGIYAAACGTAEAILKTMPGGEAALPAAQPGGSGAGPSAGSLPGEEAGGEAGGEG